LAKVKKNNMKSNEIFYLPDMQEYRKTLAIDLLCFFLFNRKCNSQAFLCAYILYENNIKCRTCSTKNQTKMKISAAAF